MHNPEFPPQNRRKVALPILRIEIEHDGATEVLDPNGAFHLAATDPERVLNWRPLPGRVSDVSGQPAILYRSDDLEVALTPAEILRLLSLDLRPEEYFALRGRYGMAFEWHDDFADPKTGEALQPLRSR